MEVLEILESLFVFDEDTQRFLITLGLRLAILLFLIFLSLVVGRYTPSLVNLVIRRFSPQQVSVIYKHLIEPLEGLLRISGTLILISLSLNVIRAYAGLYGFLDFFISLGLIVSIAWLISRLFRQAVRVYGIDLIRKLGREVDELLLVFETIANIIIGFVAAIAFAQSQAIDLVGLLAGLGIGGIAIAFAAQRTLEQILGTIVLYLDRPYIPGEYIRVSLNPHAEDVYARVESIGLRSTKLRTPAKNTLVIVPNSTMANLDIENITRGKKVMVLLYLDFFQTLESPEQALVEQVVKESTNSLFGIDPGSTRITIVPLEDKPGLRARVTFFILGSSENSIQLRKRLLELANEKISKQLSASGIEFNMHEPTVYVESPVTI